MRMCIHCGQMDNGRGTILPCKTGYQHEWTQVFDTVAQASGMGGSSAGELPKVTDFVAGAGGGGGWPILSEVLASDAAPVVRCSFCSKSQHEVAQMVAKDTSSNSAAICNECLILCLDTIMRRDAAKG